MLETSFLISATSPSTYSSHINCLFLAQAPCLPKLRDSPELSLKTSSSYCSHCSQLYTFPSSSILKHSFNIPRQLSIIPSLKPLELSLTYRARFWPLNNRRIRQLFASQSLTPKNFNKMMLKYRRSLRSVFQQVLENGSLRPLSSRRKMQSLQSGSSKSRACCSRPTPRH